MRHHDRDATVLCCQPGNTVRRTVRVGRVVPGYIAVVVQVAQGDGTRLLNRIEVLAIADFDPAFTVVYFETRCAQRLRRYFL